MQVKYIGYLYKAVGYIATFIGCGTLLLTVAASMPYALLHGTLTAALVVGAGVSLGKAKTLEDKLKGN